MAPSDKPDRGEDVGLDVLVTLITHRETITWTIFSTFVAAELVVLLFRSQITAGWELDTISFFALVLTLGSYLIVRKNLAVLDESLTAARERATPEERRLFHMAYSLDWASKERKGFRRFLSERTPYEVLQALRLETAEAYYTLIRANNVVERLVLSTRGPRGR